MIASGPGFNPVYSEEAPSLEDIQALQGVAVLEFGAPWCGHCQAAAPVVEDVLAGRPAVAHIKVYDGKGKRLGRSFRVKLWPTLILLRGGVEVRRIVRPTTSAEVQELLGDSDTR